MPQFASKRLIKSYQICASLISGLLFAGTLGLFFSQAALAETAAYTVNLSPYRGESLPSIMRAAESLASSEISRRFNQQPDLSVAQVTVLAEYNGQIVPVLVATVSRESWQRSRQIQQWTSYFNASYQLLGFNNLPTADRGEQAEAAPPPPPLNISPILLNPVEQLVEAAEDGELSDAELIELIDALD
ncbi:hypothetical protein [Almyronema epifaneia]|uniref:Uncharacterized protein n=1 Tax=Almyronema epifaneia S1 TaxID=2991925 RepID=A0ABW6I9I1_9CYAN